MKVYPLLLFLLGACSESAEYRDAGTGNAVSFPGDIIVGGYAFVNGTAQVGQSRIRADTSPDIGPEQNFIGYNGQWVHGIDVANAPGSRDYVVVGKRGSYSFEDGHIDNGSDILTSNEQGGFAQWLVGTAIDGQGLPADTKIAEVMSQTQLRLSMRATESVERGRFSVISPKEVSDQLYVRHRGGLSPTFGFGVSPAFPVGGQSYKVQIGGSDLEPSMGSLALRVGPTQTGNPFMVHDSNPQPLMWIRPDGVLSGRNGVELRAGNPLNEYAMSVKDSAGVMTFGLAVVPGPNELRLVYVTGGPVIFTAHTDGGFRLMGPTLGFYGANPVPRPTVSGSRNGNAALASLLSALESQGLIVDGTTN